MIKEIKRFESIVFPENCYAVTTTDGIFLVDPGEYTKGLKDYVLQNKNDIKCILLTHRHFDHILGTAEVLKDSPNAKTVMHKDDAEGLSNSAISLAKNFDRPQEPINADVLVADGDIISLGNTKIKVMHTPGHTSGSVCYIVDDSIFCGDTVFKLSCGRTDLPSGDSSKLLSSLKKLKNLDADYKLYPGHNEDTLLSFEKDNNPYMIGL